MLYIDCNLTKITEEESKQLLVYGLTKKFDHLSVVEDVSFKVKKKECFGILGINGAGKTTTFSMLTNELIPNSGIVYLNGNNFNSKNVSAKIN